MCQVVDECNMPLSSSVTCVGTAGKGGVWVRGTGLSGVVKIRELILSTGLVWAEHKIIILQNGKR